ncbi:MAG: EAL domain-containing protein [Burkholderiales bacterium]|nr:EAL domain-containing protein [Burkholderiales bacterium]
MNKPVIVLIVEDSEDDAKLALRALRRGGFDPTYRRVQTAAELETALAQEHWDAVISDYKMPGFTGIDALRIFRSTGLDIPFILVSGTIGEETAVDAMKAGASDYMMKKNLARLAPALERELKETKMRAAHRMAQAALADSEKRFRQMAENIRDVFFLFDAIGSRMLYISPAYEEISGRSCASLYANPESWAEAIHPDDQASAHQKYKKAKSAGNAEFEFRIVRPDGSIRWLKLRGYPVRDDAGNLARITGIAEDITDRKQDDQKFKDLLESAPDAMVIVNRDAEMVLVNAMAVNLFGWRREELLGQKIDMLVPERFRATHPENRNGFFVQPHARPMGAGLDLFGLRKDGTEFPVEISLSPLETTEGTLAITAIRDITGSKQAAQELRESERRFSDLLRNVELISVMLDHEARITYCNEHLLRLTGWRHEEVIGRHWFELFVPPEIDYMKDAFPALLADKPEARHRESEILTRSGERRLIRWNNSLLRSGAGDVIGTASIGEDITEQKQAEARIKRLNRVYAVLSGINEAIVRTGKRQDLFDEVCRIAVEQGRFRLAWIGLVDDHGLDVTPVARAGVDEGYLDNIKLTARDDAPDRCEMMARALREKTAVVCNDIGTDPQMARWRGEALRRGYRSIVVSPLQLEGKVTGLLLLYAPEAGFFDTEEMKLLGEIAGDISFALENFNRQEKFDRLARIRAVSSEINAAIVRIHGREALLRETSRIAVEHGKFDLVWIALFDQEKQKIELVAYSGFSPDAVHAVNWARMSAVQGMMSEVIRTRKVAVRNDLDTEMHAGFLRQEAIKKGHRSSVCVPFMVDDSVVGLMNLFAPGAGFFDEEELALLKEVSDNISFALEHIEKEKKIAHLSRIQAVMGSINSLIVRASDRDELFREACRIAIEEGGFRMALIAIMDRSEMKIVPVASAGKDEELLTAIKGVLSSSEGAPNTMVAQAIREKKAVVSNDSQSDPRVFFSRKYAESGVRSMAVLPLIVADEAVGALALYSEETGFFDQEEFKLLTELTGDIAFAIDHIDKRERLHYLAYYDVLTGLANRSLFLDRVTQYIHSAASSGHKLALFLLDLERFKNINDSLGRPAGDALLKQVAAWMTRNAGDANLLARVDADHFAAVMPEVKQGGDVGRLLEKWMGAFLEHPFRLGDAVFRIAAKAGVALYPDDGADAETLFRNAEAALKKAKAGGDRYLFHTQKMTEAVAGKLTLENHLRQALDNGEFVLHYQPKVNLVSGKMTSVEALIRWNDPRTGLVPPGRFIPVLEETGLIYEVGRWALRQAIADHLRWRATGLPAVRIAVNVSPLQLRNRGFAAEIEQVIGIDAQAAAGLELEITESLIMADVKHSIAILQAIRALGVTIAIDDFGTGFSSLSYLAKLPVDTLKIDRSFVIDMTSGPQGLALVSTVINLAHSLELKVVAEGVETEEQSSLLRLLGCDEMQGFLFSKPVPIEIFETKFLAPPSAT